MNCLRANFEFFFFKSVCIPLKLPLYCWCPSKVSIVSISLLNYQRNVNALMIKISFIKWKNKIKKKWKTKGVILIYFFFQNLWRYFCRIKNFLRPFLFFWQFFYKLCWRISCNILYKVWHVSLFLITCEIHINY